MSPVEQTAAMIVTHPRFDSKWPFAADDLAALWRDRIGPVAFHRLPVGDTRSLGAVAGQADGVRCLVSLDVAITPSCFDAFPDLELAWLNSKGKVDASIEATLEARRVRIVKPVDESYWSESVAELALGLTIAQLRRIPQLDAAVRGSDPEAWSSPPHPGGALPGGRGEQFVDDPRFVNGTVSGKRVRIVGAGNIASRYAAAVHALGADVAAYDPFAPTSSFALAGSRRVHSLDELVADADIFAPLIPRTAQTEGLVRAEHVAALPDGALVVLATRARICDMAAIRRRVVAREISLAADVFDVEPLPPQDPLLECENTVLTPHIAGRTRDANRSWAAMAVGQLAAGLKAGIRHA